MIRIKDPTPEVVESLVRDALAGLIGDQAETAIAAVMEAIRPAIGAVEQRRRDENLLREAYRDGFFMGRQAIRNFPWDVALWKASPSYAGFKKRTGSDATASELATRYAKYNLE